MTTLEELVVQIKVDTGNLKSDVASTQAAIKNLGDTVEQSAKKASSSAKEFDAQFKGADGKWHSYGSAGKTAYDSVGGAANKAGDDVKKFGDTSETAGNKSNNSLKNLIPSWQAVGAAVAAAGAAIAAGVGIAAKSYMDFEQTATNAASVTGLTGDAYGDALENIKAVSKELGETTVFSAKDAASAMYDLASAGFDVANMAAGDLKPILDIAAGTQTDLTNATQIVTDAVSQFGLTTQDTARIADVYATTIGSTKATMDKLGTSMSYVGPVAKSLGWDIEEASAALGVLYNSGLDASTAGTSLRGALAALMTPSDSMIATLGAMGIEFEEVNPATNELTDILYKLSEAGMTTEQAFRLFGRESAPAMLSLTENVDKVDELTGSLYECGGAAEEMADKQLDTLAGSFALLKSATEGLMLEVGEALAPAIRKAADVITALIPKATAMVGKFKDISNSPIIAKLKELGGMVLKNLIDTFGGTLEAVQDFSGNGGLGRLGQALSNAFSAFITLYKAMSDTGVFRLVGTAIEYVVRTFLWLVDTGARVNIFLADLYRSFTRAYDNIRSGTDGVRNALSAAWNWIVSLITGTGNRIYSSVTGNWNSIRNAISGAMDTIRNVLSAAWNAIRTLIMTVGGVILAVIVGSWNAIRNAVSGAMGAVQNVISAGWNAIRNLISSAMNLISSVISGGWNTARNLVSGAMNSMSSAISSGWTSIRNTVSAQLNGVVSSLSSAASSFYSAGANWINSLISGLNSKLSSLRSAYNSIMSYVKGGSSSSSSSGGSGSSSGTGSASIRESFSTFYSTPSRIEVHDTGGVAGYTGYHWMEKGEVAIPKQYNWDAAVISPIVSAISSKISAGAVSAGSGTKKVVVTINNKASDVTNLNKTIIKAAKIGAVARNV